jgi:hypothetical protein
LNKYKFEIVYMITFINRPVITIALQA